MTSDDVTRFGRYPRPPKNVTTPTPAQIDIVEQLRKMNIYMDGKWEYPPICSEAADEIERQKELINILTNGHGVKDAEIEHLCSLNAELVAALEAALDVMTINEKVRSPAWSGEATEASAIGKARAALAKVKEGK